MISIPWSTKDLSKGTQLGSQLSRCLSPTPVDSAPPSLLRQTTSDVQRQLPQQLLLFPTPATRGGLPGSTLSSFSCPVFPPRTLDGKHKKSPWDKSLHPYQQAEYNLICANSFSRDNRVSSQYLHTHKSRRLHIYIYIPTRHAPAHFSRAGRRRI